MQRRNLGLSLAAVLVTACLYTRGGFLLLPIAALPVLVHELGHVLALRLLRQRITGFALDAGGFCIRYDGTCAPAGHILAALAGPIAGALYALMGLTGADWLEQSASLSLLLTAFNLLPILPLDGGRVFSIAACELLGGRRGDRLTKAVSLVLATALLMGGTWLMWQGEGTALTLAALWLLIAQPENAVLVKRNELI